MTKRITLAALATLTLNAVACDADSEPSSTPLLAADLVDPEDAEQMVAESIDGAAALAEAVELTTDVDEDPEPLSSSQMQQIAEYCFLPGAGEHSGQCISGHLSLVTGWCIVVDPAMGPLVGYAIHCGY